MNETKQSSGLITTTICDQVALDKIMSNANPESPTEGIATKSTRLLIITMLITIACLFMVVVGNKTT